MKAVIMAGGEGSRLRPLTCDISKPMARLCGRPVLEYILDLLELHHFSQAAITLRYLPECITDHFPDYHYNKLMLDFVEETQPLGTAGSVRNACKENEDVLVISGDAMCDFDLTAAIEFHRSNGADATILAKKVDDPREYGLIDVNKDGSIAAFIEKPAFSQAISDLANTGIYILSPQALDMIPTCQTYDFAKDLFPKMLSSNMKIMCYESGGYWCDIGDLESYIRCQQDMLWGKVRCNIHGKRDENGNIFAGSTPVNISGVTAPVYFGHSVRIEPGAVVEAFSVIDDGCYIGRNSRISGSILLQNALIGARARLTGSLVCAGASIKDGAMLFENATVGAGAVIGRSATVHSGIKVWNHKSIADGTIVSEHIKVSSGIRGYFDEEGISGQIGVEFTPEFFARLGAAIGSCCKEPRIAVGCSNDSSATVLKSALISGIRSVGIGIMDFGENFKTQFVFSMSFCPVYMGVYIRGGNQSIVQVLLPGGLPATRETERNIEAILLRGEFNRCAPSDVGDYVEMGNMGMLYRSHIIRYAPRGLSGCSAMVKSQNILVKTALRDVLYKLGCDVENGFTFEISSQGDKVRIQDPELGYIPNHKIQAWCAICELQRGNDVALPYDAPRFLDNIAERLDRKILRYYNCPADNSDSETRRVAAGQAWSRDGLIQAIMLMDWIKRTGSLAALAQQLPDFEVSARTMDTTVNPAGLIRKINSKKSSAITEGVIVTDTRGIALVRPLKRGAGIRIMAEAQTSEIAEELCANIEQLLRNAQQ